MLLFEFLWSGVMIQFRQNENNYAICYYRYSSHSQNEASIEQQQKAAHRYAKEHGYTIIKEYADKAISGTTEHRPQYQLMLHEVKTIKPSVLILWKTDRLGRDRYELAFAKRKLRSLGCFPVCVAESIPEGPEGIMFESVIDGMAEYYSVRLSSNIIRGIKDNAEKALCNGRKIFGFSVDSNRKYVEDPDTAPLVRRIFKEYSSGIPMAVIARRLNEQGFVTSRGGEFNVNGLRHILHNEAYIGVYKYSGIVIEGGMPPLIDKSLFDKVQTMFARNKRKGGQFSRGLDENGDPRFWLTGKLFCGECKSSMQGLSGTSKMGLRYFYYACSNYKKHRCKHKPIRKEIVEKMVTLILQSFLSNEENLASLAVDVSMYYQSVYGDDSYLKSLESQQKETETAIYNLIRAIEKGIFSVSTQKRLTDLEEKKRSLSEAIELEKIRHDTMASTHSIAEYFKLYKNADFNNPDVRNTVLEYFVDRIYLFNDRITVLCWWDDLHEEVELEEIKNDIYAMSFDDGSVEFTDSVVISTIKDMQKRYIPEKARFYRVFSRLRGVIFLSRNMDVKRIFPRLTRTELP